MHILEDRSLRLENVGLDDMGEYTCFLFFVFFFSYFCLFSVTVTIILFLLGEYTCEADNAVGAVASTGNLIVYGMSSKFHLIPMI